MNLRITSWQHIYFYSTLITALAVAVPVTIVLAFYWMLPLHFLLKIIAFSGLIPLFIAFPVSIFGLYIVKRVNNALDLLDAQLKFDNLTGLLTRSYFMSLVEARRAKGGFLIMVDADRFKAINDTYGHEQGDMALKFIARTVQQVTGLAGVAGRLGGEEFAIYLPEADVRQATLLASAIGTALRSQPMTVEGRQVIITASMGVAADRPEKALRTALRQADVCLYAAKRAGRDRYVLADDLEAAEPATTARTA